MASGKIGEIIADATNLEINSILVDGISGRKMPGITPASLETISSWVYQFSALEKRLELDRIVVDRNHPMVQAVKQFIEEKKSLFEKYVFEENNFSDFSKEDVVEGVLNIDEMSSFREAVGESMKSKKKAAEYDAELFRLIKVQTRLMVLKNRLGASSEEQKNGGAEKYDLRDLQQLRKLWELKDGFIYAQNVVQLDGDVLTRSNLRLYRDRLIKDMASQLLEFHRKNVDVSIKHWHFIVETIAGIAKAVGEKIASPFK